MHHKSMSNRSNARVTLNRTPVYTKVKTDYGTRTETKYLNRSYTTIFETDYRKHTAIEDFIIINKCNNIYELIYKISVQNYKPRGVSKTARKFQLGKESLNNAIRKAYRLARHPSRKHIREYEFYLIKLYGFNEGIQ